MMRFLGLMLITLCCAWGDLAQMPPSDIQALSQMHKKKWHRYHALPSLRVGEGTSDTHAKIDPTSTDCRKLIAYFEKKYGIPQHLMLAIARVESRCRPWAVHHNGACLQFRQAHKALAFLKTASGNIQIGCMQLDCRSHKGKFGSMERMMTPYYNIEFAAKLLRRLHKKYGSWERAVSFYHAVTPSAQRAYCRRVARQLKALKGDPNSVTGSEAWI